MIHNAELRHQRDITHANAVAKAIREADDQDRTITPITPGPDATDARRLRGIPAVGGRGAIGGAIAGTRPDTLAFLDNIRRHRQHHN